MTEKKQRSYKIIYCENLVTLVIESNKVFTVQLTNLQDCYIMDIRKRLILLEGIVIKTKLKDKGDAMNIQVQCCGLALILVLLYFYQYQKKVELHTEKAFLRIIYVSIISLSMDILSIVMIANLETLPDYMVRMVCKLYLISLLGVVLCGLLYIVADIYSNSRAYYKVELVSCSIIAVGAIFVCCLPIHILYNPDTNVVYTYGPSDYATYAVTVVIIITSLYYIIRQKDNMNPRRRNAVFIWIILWFVAAIIQFLSSELLLVGYACSLSIMIIYLTLENPEVNLDRATGLFNQNALIQMIQERYHQKEPFSIMSLLFESSLYKNIYSESMKHVKMEVIAFLNTLPDIKVFKNTEKEIIILASDDQVMESVIACIESRFEHGWGEEESIELNPYYLYISDCNIVNDAEDLLSLIHYARQNNYGGSETRFIKIGQDISEQMFQESTMENLLMNAVENSQIEVYFQPIYSTKEGHFTSAEALARLRDEDGKIIPPGAFISIAEKNGVISKLGQIVFEKVCCFIKENKIETYGIHYIEVNLSVVQCAYENLADEYIDIMRKYDINPSMINLEITESASMSTKKTLMDNMKKLMDYGVHFSLDDFGTGQSNLNYIVEIPVSIVKFDKNMISSYFESTKAKYVMDAAIQMIHGMQLEIVSEGIETKEQYLVMKELGINYIQGYYFSRPVPEKEFLSVLRKK